MARTIRCRQVDGTILLCTNSTISTSRWHDFHGTRRKQIVHSACGNRVLSCLSCRKNRVFRLRKSCSFVPFVQKESCRKNCVFRLRKSCSFVSFVQKESCLPLAENVPFVQENSYITINSQFCSPHGTAIAKFFVQTNKTWTETVPVTRKRYNFAKELQ